MTLKSVKRTSQLSFQHAIQVCQESRCSSVYPIACFSTREAASPAMRHARRENANPYSHGSDELVLALERVVVPVGNSSVVFLMPWPL